MEDKLPQEKSLLLSVWGSIHGIVTIEELLVKLQYCAKVMQTNFEEFLGFSWLFEEVSLQTKFP